MFLHNLVQARMSRLLASALAGVTLLTLIGAHSVAQVILRVPGDSPGIPAYARVETPFAFHTDQWAAIVLYRDPACVPADFNLLKLFDAPRAFGCALTISGFEVWDNPATDAGPRHTISSGFAVPVWFVSWPVLQGAMADGVLTIAELESLAPLKGLAKTFHEMLNPFVPPGITGGANIPHLTITASGILADGRSFQYDYTGGTVGKEHVRIVFASKSWPEGDGGTREITPDEFLRIAVPVDQFRLTSIKDDGVRI